MRAARRAAASLLPPSANFGPARLGRRRRDVHRAPVVLERLARPRRLERADRLAHARRPLRHRDVEHGELVAHVPARDDQVEATFAQEIDDGDVLGEAERVVERHDQRHDVDPDGGGARRDRRRHRQRAREVAVVGAVVLRQTEEHPTEPVGPLGHVEGRPVPVGHRHAGEGGIAQIETDAEHRHGRQGIRTRSRLTARRLHRPPGSPPSPPRGSVAGSGIPRNRRPRRPRRRSSRPAARSGRRAASSPRGSTRPRGSAG